MTGGVLSVFSRPTFLHAIITSVIVVHTLCGIEKVQYMVEQTCFVAAPSNTVQCFVGNVHQKYLLDKTTIKNVCSSITHTRLNICKKELKGCVNLA